MNDIDRLRIIYDKTDGYCRYCDKKISWKNYGKYGGKGAWEIDHSIPISRGGTDHLNNLFPSCIDCNREKGSLTGTQFKNMISYDEDDVSIGDFLIGMGFVALGIGVVRSIMNK